MERQIEEIVLTAGGGTVNLALTDNYTAYRITSAAITLTSNWTIQESGTPYRGHCFEFEYEADVTPDGNKITIMGDTFPTEYLQKRVKIFSLYNGTSWVNVFSPSFAQGDLVTTNHIIDGNVTTSKILDKNITSDKIQDYTANSAFVINNLGRPALVSMAGVGTILGSNGTGAAALTVSGDISGMDATGKFTIAANAITNAKMANMAANTIKLNNTGGSTTPTDLAVANTQIVIGNGAGFTAASISKDATMTNAGALSVLDATSTTASGQTAGLIRAKYINSTTLKALMDGVIHNCFSVSTGDVVLCIKFWTQTPHGAPTTVDMGPDAAATGAGADGDGILLNANAASAGVCSSDDVAGTYIGPLQAFGGFVATANGYITVQSSIDISAGAWIGSATMYYIPA